MLSSRGRRVGINVEAILCASFLFCLAIFPTTTPTHCILYLHQVLLLEEGTTEVFYL